MNRRQFLAAGAGLTAALLGQRAFGATEKAVVRGTVTGEGRPLDGVLVSDGRRVVQTDEDGAYELPVGPESGPFVFVTTPRGYWTDRFYVPISAAAKAGRADFPLAAREQPDRFRFAFITDMHLEKPRWGVPKLRATFAEINALQPQPAFVWAQGDISLQGGAGKDYADALDVLEMPVRNGAGNHEMTLGHADPRDDYHRRFGPTYYSFDWGPLHCVVLDGNKVIPGAKGWKAVHGAVEGAELAWLEADLAAQPEGKPILVGVHIPIVSTYPERRAHSPKDAPYWEMTNDVRLTQLFARHKVRLVLQGHMHENERATVRGVEYAETISASGSWWKSGEGFERGVDGVPRGYRIVAVDGESIRHWYRSSAESRVYGEGEFVGLDGEVPASQEAEFVFNAYDAPNGSSAIARIDHESWRPMPAFPAVNQSIGLKKCHHFRLVADTTALGQGKHVIEARVTWPDGTLVAEKEVFAVDDE